MGQNNANGFVRQAYVAFAVPGSGKLCLGRFTFLDGAEVTPNFIVGGFIGGIAAIWLYAPTGSST